MGDHLSGRKIAFLATNGVEQIELTQPLEAARQAGATCEIVSIRSGEIQGVNGMEMGDRIPVDREISEVSAADYDALVLPGGVANPDKLRMDARAVVFVRGFFEAGKPVAAICHGPWMLVEADVVRGRTLTSYPSLQTDIRNAGGQWVDAEVHNDSGLITSRRPSDLPAFIGKMIEEFVEGVHPAQAQRTRQAGPTRTIP